MQHEKACTAKKWLDFKAYAAWLYLHNRAICRKVFMQVSQYVSFNTDIFHIGRDTGRGLRENTCRVVNKIRVKAGLFNILFAETAGELIKNGSDHLKVCQFMNPLMLEIKLITQKTLICQVNVADSRFCPYLFLIHKIRPQK